MILMTKEQFRNTRIIDDKLSIEVNLENMVQTLVDELKEDITYKNVKKIFSDHETYFHRYNKLMIDGMLIDLSISIPIVLDIETYPFQPCDEATIGESKCRLYTRDDLLDLIELYRQVILMLIFRSMSPTYLSREIVLSDTGELTIRCLHTHAIRSMVVEQTIDMYLNSYREPICTVYTSYNGTKIHRELDRYIAMKDGVHLFCSIDSILPSPVIDSFIESKVLTSVKSRSLIEFTTLMAESILTKDPLIIRDRNLFNSICSVNDVFLSNTGACIAGRDIIERFISAIMASNGGILIKDEDMGDIDTIGIASHRGRLFMFTSISISLTDLVDDRIGDEFRLFRGYLNISFIHPVKDPISPEGVEIMVTLSMFRGEDLLSVSTAVNDGEVNHVLCWV
jgi:hypothetical protein